MDEGSKMHSEGGRVRKGTTQMVRVQRRTEKEVRAQRRTEKEKEVGLKNALPKSLMMD
jgi:hypothetical protein